MVNPVCSKKKLLLINGPNLNLLGSREPDVYGTITLKQIEEEVRNLAFDLGFYCIAYQSNSESELVNFLHNNRDSDYIIINPAAYTHTSVALRDALLGVGVPFVEVHLTNTASRENFRKESLLSDVADGVLMGFGHYGYIMALNYITVRSLG